jgi:hypothetical protein
MSENLRGGVSKALAYLSAVNYHVKNRSRCDWKRPKPQFCTEVLATSLNWEFPGAAIQIIAFEIL